MKQTFLRTQQVMIVEDDPVFTEQLDMAIRGANGPWRVHHCRDAAQAFAFLDQPLFYLDLALVDLGLPDISGVEVIRKIRKRFPAIPILVVSVISAERSVLSAIRSGARGYLLKDDSKKSIASAIDDAMAGNYPISPALARYLFKIAGSPSSLGVDEIVALTSKEQEALKHLSKGRSYKETAELMGVALSTIQSHVRNLYSKLEVHSQMQAVEIARERGLL